MHNKNGRWAKSIKGFFGRLFCRRNIIIVAEHKTGHIPLSLRKQLCIVFGVLAVVSWVSYSTGSYVKAQSVIAEKDRKIEYTKQENSRIESEFSLLKRDLVNVMGEEKKGEVSEYAQFVLEQYNKAGADFVGPMPQGAELADAKEPDERQVASNIIFERIAYLENIMEQQRQHYNRLMHEIEQMTGGKIKELETAIKKSGLDVRTMQQRAEKAQMKSEEGNPSGGPYDPLEEGALLPESYGDLYGNLERMMLLHRVIEHMPVAEPMRDARRTSGFGARRDPFTGRYARHGGLDFAARDDTSVYATSDGIVSIAGRKGAYGNLIEIDHGLGITTRYGHLSRVLVKPGQKVYAGQRIGVQGNTGRSTGAHLHYEVRLDDRTLNPSRFIGIGDTLN